MVGVFDWTGQALEWLGKRWSEDWADVRKTFTESWQSVPGNLKQVGRGMLGMVTAPFKDDGDFWGSARMLADSTLNQGTALLGGTLGTLFQIPILHETTWLLDKAYRYGVARPIATGWIWQSNYTRDAYRQGSFTPARLVDHMMDFNNLRKAWNDSEHVTPGQALVYYNVMSARGMDDMDEAMRWADENDPRTKAGQAKWNSPEASFWLKYGSGTGDFVLNLIADPGHAAGSLGKLARVRLINKVADEKYVAAGKVEKELGTTREREVYKLAKEVATSEELRVKAFGSWARGADAAALLHTAAKMGDEVWRDTWLTLRAFDEKAYQRLVDRAPEIAANYADMYANYTIADADYQLGLTQAAKGADPLVKTKVEAFVDAMVAREGVWGTSLGMGFGEAMPRVLPDRVAKIKTGYHDYIMYKAPVYLARPLQNLLPSQGFTSWINAGDNTTIGVRQFRGNIERVNTMGRMANNGGRDLLATPEEINQWVSDYGRAQSDGARFAIASRVDNELTLRVFKRWGVDEQDVPLILAELNKTRHGSRALGMHQKVYLSGELRAAAKRAREAGNARRAKELDNMLTEHEASVKAGAAVDEYFAFHRPDGGLHMEPLNAKHPVMRTQFTEGINMMDYRQLNGHLRWWKAMHPTPRKVLDPDAPGGKRGEVPLWRVGLAQAAKAKGWYEHVIGTADWTMTLWKASVLGRLGQGPRGVASDWAHMQSQWGKLPFLTSALMIVPNAIRNFSRGKLMWEAGRDWLAEQRAGGRQPAHVVDVDGPVVTGNVSQHEHTGYDSHQAMFADGFLSMDDYIKLIGEFRKSPVPLTAVQQKSHEREAKLWAARYEATKAAKGKPADVQREIHGKADLDYRRGLSFDALQAAGKTAFLRDGFADELAAQLIAVHEGRQNAPGYKDNPYAAGAVVVDPFMGAVPKLYDETPLSKLHEVFDIKPVTTLSTAMKKNVADDAPLAERIDLPELEFQLANWTLDHADELLRPDTFQALIVQPNGHIAIGTARVSKEAAESGKATKVNSAQMRVRNYHREGIKDISHMGRDIVGRDGKPLGRIEGVFEGPQGQQFQSMISARENPALAAGNVIEDWATSRRIKANDAWRSVKPTEPGHGPAWERVVNAQVAGDPVMQALLRRKSDGTYRTPDEVIHLVNNTPWGTKWVNQMRFRGGGYANQIYELSGIVDELLPLPDGDVVPNDRWDLAHQVREDALNNRARYSQLEGLFRQEGDSPAWRERMPSVHGAQVEYARGAGLIFDKMMGTLRWLQKWVSDLPTDKWARFPAMSWVYQKHTSELLRIANEHFPDGAIPAGVRDTIMAMGREKAYHDIRYRLYDTAQRNDFAYATRLLMPFSTAMMDSYIKFGRSVRENPMLLVQGAYYWDVFEREEMIQDENGHVLRIEADGTRAWYSVDPKTGEKTRVPDDKVGKNQYVQFVLPSPLSKVVGRKYFGVDAHPVFAINKNNLNVFMNLPSGGPLVAFPANQFALANPEFGENEIVRKYILPYGPSTDAARTFLPPTFKAAWDALNSEEGASAEANAKAIFQAELTAYGLGTRNEPPTFAEAREKAAGLLYLRLATAFLSPASFQVQSPYKPYVDAYHQLRSDPTVVNPDEEFMRRYGDEFYAMTMTVTRNNTGLSASLESSQAYDKYKDLIAQFPEFGGLIVGSEGVGAFAKSVYEAQKQTRVGPGDNRTLREITPLSESVQDLNRRTIWNKYSQMMDLIESALVDRGLPSLRGRGAQDLLDAKEAFVQANMYWQDPQSGQTMLSPWYVDYRNSDAGSAEYKLNALRVIAADPKLSKRDDMRGLLEYFSMRDRMQAEMARRGYRSLASMQARGLQDKWSAQVHSLVESNLGFAAVWNRWLSNDDALDAPAFAGR